MPEDNIAHILIVDQNPEVIDFMVAGLRHQNYTWEIARSGVMAMDMLNSGKYDLAIIDIAMPDIDGMVLTQIAKEARGDIKVIITTDKNHLEMTVDTLSLGASDFIIKPFEDVKEIRYKASHALEVKRLAAEKERLLQDLQRTNKELAGAKAEIEVWNKELEQKVQNRTKELEESKKKIQAFAQKLQQTNEELKKLDELKTDFLANVSHELRTPMTAILGYSEIFLEADNENISEQFKEFAQMIYDSGNQLFTLIQDLLYFSELEKGSMVLNRMSCQINTILCEAINEITDKTRSKNIEIHFMPNTNLPRLNLDQEKTKLAILKLLDNAVKFNSENGNIWIETKVESDRLIIFIKDDGVGIPKNNIPHIFKRFRQGDGSATREFGGVGMGLSMAKEIVAMQQGKLWLMETEIGVGSTFAMSFSITN